jgi:hypothetical protein
MLQDPKGYTKAVRGFLLRVTGFDVPAAGAIAHQPRVRSGPYQHQHTRIEQADTSRCPS